MNVKELINLLSKYDENTEVKCSSVINSSENENELLMCLNCNVMIYESSEDDEYEDFSGVIIHFYGDSDIES